LRSIASAWNGFWFESDHREPMQAFRVCLSAILFFFYLSRTGDLELFYTEHGLLSADIAREIMPMDHRYSLFDWVPAAVQLPAVKIAHWGLLGALLALAFGWAPRLAAIIAFALHLSFIHRNMMVMFGVDMIGTFFLFYFCLADGRREVPARPDFRSMLGSVAFRLAQIQVCIIYAYSGLEKIKGPLWWNGEALWSVLANSQLARFDFSWIASFPIVIVLATYSTLLWEIYFPALVWARPLRPWMLSFGVALHLGIAIAINIWWFGFLMIATYLLFVEPRSLEKFLRRVGPWLTRISSRGILHTTPQVSPARSDKTFV
jgi:hypothetical protein